MGLWVLNRGGIAACSVEKRKARELTTISTCWCWNMGEERASKDQRRCYLICWWRKVKGKLQRLDLGQDQRWICTMHMWGDDGPVLRPPADCWQQQKYSVQIMIKKTRAGKCKKDCLPLSFLIWWKINVVWMYVDSRCWVSGEVLLDTERRK